MPRVSFPSFFNAPLGMKREKKGPKKGNLGEEEEKKS